GRLRGRERQQHRVGHEHRVGNQQPPGQQHPVGHFYERLILARGLVRRTNMEKMPYRDLEIMVNTNMLTTELQTATTTNDVVSSDWRQQLPVLTGKQVVLRQLRTSDAAPLFAMLTTEDVARFIA